MAACIHIWFLVISVLKKVVKYKVKRKREKQGNIQLFDIYFVKSVTSVFFHRLPVGLILNHRILAATAFHENYNIPINCFFRKVII